MTNSTKIAAISRRTVLSIVVAALLGMAVLAAPVAAAGTGQPQFYTDEFHFQFERTDLTEICGFQIWQTVDGEVHGWDRYNADGSFAGGNVQVTVTGTYYSDQATLTFVANTRNIDIINPDGSDTGFLIGMDARVVVPGEGAVYIVAGRIVVTFPAGGGEPTLDFKAGHDTGDAFFGSVGNPGTICTLLAG